jgi:hypothetical protein
MEYGYGSILPERPKRRKRIKAVASPETDSALALGPPQLHHICVAVHGGRWGSTAASDLKKNRLDSVYGDLWQLTVGFGTSLKIMVSPVRIRVPPLLKYLQSAEKVGSPRLQSAAF